MGLRQPTDQELRATDWALVVVGQGYSALVNCATRLRVGKLPNTTLLVGQPDPWRRYAKHPMGQYPALLALPGFSEDAQPRDQIESDFLSSRRFAALNRLQLRRLLIAHNTSHVMGVVESPLSFVNGFWMVPLTRRGKSVTLRAKKVDICTGPGPGRVFMPGSGRVFGPWTDGIRDNFEPTLLQELMDDVGHRAFVAENFMAVRRISGKVLVAGEGPLAASVVEHALRCGADAVCWVGRPIEMTDAFPPSLRYDGLVRSAQKVRECGLQFNASIDNGKSVNVKVLNNVMVPNDPRLTIFLGCISCIGIPSATLIGAAPFPALELHDAKQIVHPKGTPLSVLFDVIVVSSSSQNTESERLSAAHLVKSVPKSVSAEGLVPISRNGMFVGLQVPDESLRVLGAASRNSSLTDRFTFGLPEELLYKSWHDSLCGQARMPGYAMGITVGAVTIALANEYYSASAPDTCAQTAPLPPCPLRANRQTRAEPFALTDLTGTGYLGFPRAG